MVRREFCPTGRRVYRTDDPDGDLREGRVATRTTLRAMRLQPGDGQEPVGSTWIARQWVPLYMVADAVAMPALSPKRQAAYTAARTCARCGHESLWPKGRDAVTGERLCVECPAAEPERSA